MYRIRLLTIRRLYALLISISAICLLSVPIQLQWAPRNMFQIESENNYVMETELRNWNSVYNLTVLAKLSTISAPAFRAVNAVLPIADFPYDKGIVDQPCSVVRMTNFMGRKLALGGSPLCQWLQKPASMANGNFYLYGDEMALLYDVTIDPERRHPGAKGGEEMEKVWDQNEKKEYFDLKGGFFRLYCSQRPQARFNKPSSHLNAWVRSLQCEQTMSRNGGEQNTTNSTQDVRTVKGLTFALQRYEYANVYFVILNLYSAFLATLAFSVQPRDVTILLVDGHPKSSLDAVWNTLFGSVVRAGYLPAPTRFAAMGWIPMTHNVPLRQLKAKRVNYLEEFRKFVLNGYGVNETRVLNCSSLRILFVWRHDYVAHPRNKRGSVSRKIVNEQELLTEMTKAAARGDKVQGRQLDAEPITEQLRHVMETDVMIGMHGAGLVHSLFLPRHASLVEFYPKKFSHSHEPFRAIASWRGLQYATWRNKDVALEKGEKGTYVPPSQVLDLVRKVRNKMCG